MLHPRRNAARPVAALLVEQAVLMRPDNIFVREVTRNLVSKLAKRDILTKDQASLLAKIVFDADDREAEETGLLDAFVKDIEVALYQHRKAFPIAELERIAAALAAYGAKDAPQTPPAE